MDVDEEKPSKAQKKAAKKQKGAEGQAVPTPADGEKKKEKEKETEKPGKEKKKKEKTKPVDLSHIPQKELAGGLKVRDVVVGDGPDVKKGQKIKMRYIGRLTDGSIFDKNTSGKPVSGFAQNVELFRRYSTDSLLLNWAEAMSSKVYFPSALIFPFY
jgi:FK506-binding nuclear protein